MIIDTELHRTLSAQIADVLARAIIDGRHPPGARLNEVSLASELGVSRSPLREALRMLETRGLVRITPQRGARVTMLTHEEVLHLFEIRAVLVGLAARQVSLRMDPGLRQVLSTGIERLEEALDNPLAYAKASAEVTLLLAHASGNLRLEEMIRSFADQIGRYARLGLASAERRKRSLRNWRLAFAAMRAGDPDRSEVFQRRLAEENRDAVLKVLSSEWEQPITGQLARRKRA